MRLLQDAHGLSVASKQFCYCIRSSKSLKAALSLRAFLISFGAYIGIFPLFQKARIRVFTHEFNERWYVGLPVFWKSFEILKTRVHTALCEQVYGVLGVLVEVSVKDSLT